MKRIVLLILMCLPLASAGCDNTPNWQEFTPKDGRFSILMPGTPREETQTISGLDVPTFWFDIGVETYAVSYFEPPTGTTDPANVDATLDAMRDSSILSAGGKLLEEEAITLQNFPGRKLKVKPQSEPGFVISHIFLVNERVYFLLYQSKKDDIPADNADKFFNSFKLTPE
jgi:hypothetical protein